MKKISVFAGVCGEKVEATAESVDGRHVKISITRCCVHVEKMKATLENGPLDGFELMRNIRKSQIYDAAGECLPHVTCPVPSALHKLVEAELGLAVPVDVTIKFEKE
ncbi:MAG: hypothetical protein OEZ04_08765 [Nitrospinota bacterium]|nr:hypothetical protein [Nitrospinota bacterium]